MRNLDSSVYKGSIGYGVIYSGSERIETDDTQDSFKWTNGYVATSGITLKLEGFDWWTTYYLAIYVLSRGDNTGIFDDFEWYKVTQASSSGYVKAEYTISPSTLRERYLLPSDVSGYSYMYIAMDTCDFCDTWKFSK